jgi:hypothetical protein
MIMIGDLVLNVETLLFTKTQAITAPYTTRNIRIINHGNHSV